MIKFIDDHSSNYYINSFHSAIGWIVIAGSEISIHSISITHQKPTKTTGCSQILIELESQILEYLNGQRVKFAIKLKSQGTPFQQMVWKTLCKIPFGESKSYGQLAHAIGNPRASRAVGMANNKNPFPIIVPCHRIIGANGRLVGYAGGLGIKKYLLDLEGIPYKE